MPFIRSIRLPLIIATWVSCGLFAPFAELRADAPTSANASEQSLDFKEDSSWKPARFGGDGPVKMQDGVLKLGFGDPLTGVRWEGDFPKHDYEISLEARRTGGFDFFCGLTLPIADQRFSLIVGGWGGSLTGLSSIDGLDASNNETMLIRDYKSNQWYKIRVRVTGDSKIQVWLDDDEIIMLDRNGRVMDIRSEMEECTPVGLAAFQSEAELRNVKVRRIAKIDPGQTKAAEDGAKSP